MARTRNSKEIWQQVNDGLADYTDQKREQELESALKDSNNISFTWLDNPTSPDEEMVLETAFQLSDRPELLARAEELDLFSDYYITDVPQGSNEETGRLNDSRSLSNKYGKDVKLQPGNSYFLCKI
jgi:hypothetical protein